MHHAKRIEYGVPVPSRLRDAVRIMASYVRRRRHFKFVKKELDERRQALRARRVSKSCVLAAPAQQMKIVLNSDVTCKYADGRKESAGIMVLRSLREPARAHFATQRASVCVES